MSVDDVWKEPEVEKKSRVWDICRRIVCTIICISSKIVIGIFNRPVMYNEAAWHRAIAERPTGRPLVTVLNHTSLLDAFLIPCYLKRRYLASMYSCVPWTPGLKQICHMNYPTSMFFTLAKCLPIVRGDGVYQRTMNFISKQLNRGDWVHIFPEGRINLTKEFIRYKWGVGRLVADCKIDPVILPMYQLGMDDILPNKTPYIPRIRKRITIVVGEPIDVSSTVAEMRQREASEEEVRKYITDVIQDEMELLAQRARVLHYSSSHTRRNPQNVNGS